MLTALQALPRDAELLAFEAGCEDYCEREVDEVDCQGGRVYLHHPTRGRKPSSALVMPAAGWAAPGDWSSPVWTGLALLYRPARSV